MIDTSYKLTGKKINSLILLTSNPPLLPGLLAVDDVAGLFYLKESRDFALYSSVSLLSFAFLYTLVR